MDDSSEEVAALAALSKFRTEFNDRCVDDPEISEKLVDLHVITQDEKERADGENDFHDVISKFQQKIKEDPQIFTEFCRKLVELNDPDAKKLADSLLGMS